MITFRGTYNENSYEIKRFYFPDRLAYGEPMPIDYSKYPPNWFTELRPAVLRRAENKCECCGLENKQIVFCVKLWIRDKARYALSSIWFRNEQDAIRESRGSIVWPVKVVITIAHLDHDERNHKVTIERLKAMCQICHLRYDAQEKYRRVNEKWKTK